MGLKSVEAFYLFMSDIHHHRYTNGITLDDTLDIEEQFSKAIVELDVDYYGFCGDLTLSRNPEAEVLYAVNEALINRLSTIGKLPRGIYISGNHDYSTKSSISHSLISGIHQLKDVGYNIDTSVGVESLSIYASRANLETRFHCISADTNPTDEDKKHHNKPVENPDISIAMFHNLVDGTRLQNGQLVSTGSLRNYLDDPCYDLVVGGDNHLHQDLNFKNTVGYHVGAPMQHNWGDSGAKRGFLLAKIIKHSDGNKEVSVSLIETKHPKFIKHAVRCETAQDLGCKLPALPDMDGNIIRVTLSGPPAMFTGLSATNIANSLQVSSKARSVKVLFDVDVPDFVTPDHRTSSDSDVWDTYIATAKDADGVDLDELNKLAKTYIND